MYRKIAERDTFKVLLADLGWTEASTIDQFQDQARSDGDHDIRAALVCLLTAGFAALGSAVIVVIGRMDGFGYRRRGSGAVGLDRLAPANSQA